jgi:RNA 3'-terminal phosphate cyclase (ATP)
VADEAVDPLIEWVASGAAVDPHLADQLTPFLALAAASSTLTCQSASNHLKTVAWVIQQFVATRISLDEAHARVDIVPGSR